MLCINSVNIEIIKCIRNITTYINSINIHSIWYSEKALSLSFPKLFRIENWLNIKKVMSKNVCRVCINIRNK